MSELRRDSAILSHLRWLASNEDRQVRSIPGVFQLPRLHLHSGQQATSAEESAGDTSAHAKASALESSVMQRRHRLSW